MTNKRLNAIIDEITSEAIIDVGSDHGYLLIEAVKKNKVKHGLATDINKGPLENAKRNIKNNSLESVIKCQISNGLISVNNEEVQKYDGITICGMGGSLIAQIIEDSKEKIIGKTLYLQANNKNNVLRKKLQELNFEIQNEKLIEDNDIIYEIIVAKSVEKQKKMNEKELFFGPVNLKGKNELFYKKYKDEFRYLEKILKELESKNIKNEKLKREYEMIKDEICY